MMHTPTGLEHPGREGGREGGTEGGRLQAVCDCATYNDFETHDDLAMQIHHWV